MIFAVTDFWGPYFSTFGEKSKEGDRATGEYAFSVEVERGRAIVDAIEQVMNEEGGRGGLERFVLSTLPSFKEQSKGKYTFVYHFDSKAVVTAYLKEKKELWEKSSLLNMGFYADNLVRYGGIMGAAKVCFSPPLPSISPSPSASPSPFVPSKHTNEPGHAKQHLHMAQTLRTHSNAPLRNPLRHRPIRRAPGQRTSKTRLARRERDGELC